VTCDAIDNFIAAMFNSGVNAFSAQIVTIPSANARTAMAFEGSYAPRSTAAQTIAVRVGCNIANAALNGIPGGRTLGGASGATLTVEEIAP
jgi:hypothetical protein